MAKKTLVKSNSIQGLEQGGGIVFITFPDNWRNILQGSYIRDEIPADEFEEMFGDVFKNIKLNTIYYMITDGFQYSAYYIDVGLDYITIELGYNTKNTEMDSAEIIRIQYDGVQNTYSIVTYSY